MRPCILERPLRRLIGLTSQQSINNNTRHDEVPSTLAELALSAGLQFSRAGAGYSGPGETSVPESRDQACLVGGFILRLLA